MLAMAGNGLEAKQGARNSVKASSGVVGSKDLTTTCCPSGVGWCMSRKLEWGAELGLEPLLQYAWAFCNVGLLFAQEYSHHHKCMLELD